MSAPHRPAPFIVGAPRSGTTLLRLMLDAHSDLAIPAETAFHDALQKAGTPGDPSDLVRLLTDLPTWGDMTIDASDLASEVSRLAVPSVTEVLRSFYRLYATRHGKTRFGDKTTVNVYHLPLVQQTLPEAHFLHVIRDGRDVALSLRQVWFAPSQDITVLAHYWADAVRAGRAGGAQCQHYLEVRYDDLVSRPEATLRTVCDFLDLPFESGMLDYHRGARERLSEAQGRVLDDGTVITLDQRLQQQRLTSSPPDASRLGVWRDELSPEERAAFDVAAGPLLRELGYA